MNKYTKLLTKAADEILSMIAEAGNADRNYFQHLFKPYPNSTYRFIMYPKRNMENIPKEAFLSKRFVGWG